MAKRDKASIYVDAQELLYVLYDAQFEMDKRDRPVLAVRLLNHTEQVIANFSLAFESEDKLPYIDKMLAEFEVVKVELRFAIDKHMIKNPATINKVTELVVKMNESITKWRGYVISARQDRHPGGVGSNG